MRTRFKREIVTEFLPPSRPNKKQRVIILAGGMPTVPNKKELLEFFSNKGFWIFHPRYRGTWESDGKLFSYSPHQDILDVIDGIHKKFFSIGNDNIKNKKAFKLTPDEIYIIGASFGGPATILASRDKRVNKAMIVCPVIDWKKMGKDEPLKLLAKFTEEAYGNGYRIVKNGWEKIASGKFYNPVNHIAEIDGSKLLIIHTKDDTVCPYQNSKKFADQTKSKLITLTHGGHNGSSLLLKPRFQKIFLKFIKN